MKLTGFDYELPRELVAQYPLNERDACRLMLVDRAQNSISHTSFRDIAGYLNPGDLLVLNDTKVLPCRLKGRRSTGGAVEALLLRHTGDLRFEVLLKPGRLKMHERVHFDGSLTGIITGKSQISFEAVSAAQVYKTGTMPLPPYIKRGVEASDAHNYQTVYARCEGAIAAPTAGLHFTDELFDRLSARGVDRAYVTLHVGPGTFKPVKAADIREHVMDTEWFTVYPDTQRRVSEARGSGKRVVAVGTTSVRSLETFAQGKSGGETSLFIYPGYRFRLVDCMVTNFHLPKTTLFMLTCAFGGTDLIKRAYAEAITQKYRFYSYGDAMLII